MTVQKQINFLLATLPYIILVQLSLTILLAQAEDSIYGPTKSGDLIWNIAGKVTPNSSVTKPQMILSLLKANPQAFKVPCNFNSLKIKEILKIPAMAEIQEISATDANAEFKRQNDEWTKRRRNPIKCPTIESPVVATKTPTETPAVEVPTPVTTVPQKTIPATAEKTTPTPAVVPPSPPATTAPTKPVSLTTPPPVAAAPPVLPPVASPPPQLVPEESTTAMVAAATPSANSTTAPTTPVTGPPAQTEAPSASSSSLMWIILSVGGLLAALIIGGLLHKHTKQHNSTPVDTNVPTDESNRSAPTIASQAVEVDDMPLHTEIKAENITKDEEKFKL